MSTLAQLDAALQALQGVCNGVQQKIMDLNTHVATLISNFHAGVNVDTELAQLQAMTQQLNDSLSSATSLDAEVQSE